MQDNDNNFDLGRHVSKLSYKAFELAKQAASGKGDKAQLMEQAGELNNHLEEVFNQIQSAPTNEQARLNSAWSDARLDVGYVMSGGELSTSTRLYYYLEDLKQGQA